MNMIKLVGLVVVISALTTCTKILNVVGDGCSWFTSEADEVAMGDSLNAQIRGSSKYHVYSNTSLANYITGIGNAIVLHQGDRSATAILKYKFAVLQDTSINAFATPGGYVYIHTGLIKACRSEAELAGVIAHEIAHVTNRHTVKSLCEAQTLGAITNFALGDSSIIAQMLDGLLFMNYISQPDELQADSCGIQYLAASGYNPNGMITMLQMLKSRGADVFEPLSTHPSADHRIEQATRILGRITGYCNTDSCLFKSRLDAQRVNLP